jgi:Concanavalin A-like lectin/glucanases superfamily
MKIKLILFLLLLAVSISCKKSTNQNSTTSPVTSPYPTDGLVSYFKFDNNLKDEQGYAKDGVPTGGITFSAGKSESAIELNGIDQKIVFSPKEAKKSYNISISCWFKTAEATNKRFISSDYFLITVYPSSGKVGFTAGAPPSISYNASGSFTLGQWTHITGTYDGTNIKVYINGVLAESVNHPDNINGFINADLTVGFGKLGYWSGSIDDLFIYNRALSQAEVDKLYNLHK